MEINEVSSTIAQGSTAAVRPVSAPVSAPEVEVAAQVEAVAASEPSLTVQEQSQEPSPSTIKSAVERINSKANSVEAVYGFHEATNRVTIKIVDKESKKTIKEFPAEETLDMIAKAWELAGFMVDEKR